MHRIIANKCHCELQSSATRRGINMGLPWWQESLSISHCEELPVQGIKITGVPADKSLSFSTHPTVACRTLKQEVSHVFNPGTNPQAVCRDSLYTSRYSFPMHQRADFPPGDHSSQFKYIKPFQRAALNPLAPQFWFPQSTGRRQGVKQILMKSFHCWMSRHHSVFSTRVHCRKPTVRHSGLFSHHPLTLPWHSETF